MNNKNELRLILVLALGLAVFLWAGTQSFWTDSEMWNASAVKYMFTGHPSYNFTIKPLLDFILYLNFQVAKLLGVHPMETGRVLFALNAAFAAFVVFRLARRWGNNVAIAGTFVFFWSAHSFFIKRATHLRSDLLVMTLVLILFWIRSFPRWERMSAGLRFCTVCFIAILGFLITPKAVLLVGLWGMIFLAGDFKLLIKNRRQFLLMSSGMIILAITVVLLSGLQNSLEFFVKSFTSDNTGIPYFSIIRWEHVNRFISENALFVFLWLINLYFGFYKRKEVPSNIRPVFDYANAMLLLLLVYPDRLPFFIVSLTPFWILPLAALWPRLQETNRVPLKISTRVALLVLFFSAISGAYWSYFSLVVHNSRDQKTFVRWINEKKEQLHGLQVYDVVGVLPFEQVHHWFLGPAEGRNIDVLHNIKDQNVDVIIGASKLGLLGQPLWQLLANDYWNDGSGLFIRKWKIPLKGKSVTAESLERTFLDLMPYLKNYPRHQLRLNILAPGGVSQTRYAQWQNSDKKTEPFSPDFSLEDLQKHEKLLLPPSAKEAEILPIMLATPFSKSWLELFRFDTEI